MKRDVPSDTQDMWQIIENLREDLKRLEDEIKQRFTVLTQVNHALTHLALSTHEQAVIARRVLS